MLKLTLDGAQLSLSVTSIPAVMKIVVLHLKGKFDGDVFNNMLCR